MAFLSSIPHRKFPEFAPSILSTGKQQHLVSVWGPLIPCHSASWCALTVPGALPGLNCLVTVFLHISGSHSPKAIQTYLCFPHLLSALHRSSSWLPSCTQFWLLSPHLTQPLPSLAGSLLKASQDGPFSHTCILCFLKKNTNLFNWRIIILQYCSEFCHRIIHGCTCVPHPEPLSHLPPHPIPLGHPSAPAPSILSHASNLDWRFVTHMIIYMFQCHSPKSSQLHPLPQSPKDCSIHLCLFCCLTYRVIVTILLKFLYMH